MRLKKSIPGLFAFCIINFCVAEIAAIATPIEQPVAQADTEKSNQLTEESIRKVLAGLQAAVEKKDVEGVLKFMAPFATSEVTVESDGVTVNANLYGKDEHRGFLEKTYPTIQNRRTISNRVDMRISPDGQLGTATIFRVREYTTQNGGRFLSQGTDTIRFAMVDNQPMVVSTTLTGWVAQRPPLKPRSPESKPQP